MERGHGSFREEAVLDWGPQGCMGVARTRTTFQMEQCVCRKAQQEDSVASDTDLGFGLGRGAYWNRCWRDGQIPYHEELCAKHFEL